MFKKKTSSWNASESWYTQCVGEKGHHYHQTVVLPAVLRLLCRVSSVLDLGCGQGVLARHLPEKITYCGVDLSESLIASARKMTTRPNAQFVVGNATEQIPVEKTDFDCACFILSLQNMDKQADAIATARRHLKKGGTLLIVLNHPCFRIPRQSSWGVDDQAKLQYRRVNSYMTPQEIPIQTNPGLGAQSPTTYSYHHPLSDYISWLNHAGFSVTHLEEWCSDKKSEGSRARMEDRSRREIPLFMALLCRI